MLRNGGFSAAGCICKGNEKRHQKQRNEDGPYGKAKSAHGLYPLNLIPQMGGQSDRLLDSVVLQPVSEKRHDALLDHRTPGKVARYTRAACENKSREMTLPAGGISTG